MGTEGGRVRFSVASKPKGSGGTGRARKDVHRKLPSEKTLDVMRSRGFVSFLAPGAKGGSRSVGAGVCEGGGMSRATRLDLSMMVAKLV